jgi:hypothetical protein
MARSPSNKGVRILKGYEIFKKIWAETKGGTKFEDHPLAQIEFEEKSKRK